MSTRAASARGLAHTVLALALGVAAATGAVLWLHHHRAAQQARADGLSFHAPAGDRVDATVDALRGDGVYVAPDGRSILGDTGERAVERAVASSTVPVYVVVWAPHPELGFSDAQAAEAIAARLDQRTGVLFLWEGPQQGAVQVLGPGGYLDHFDSYIDFVGDPAVTLPKAVRAAADVTYFGGGGGRDYWGGVGGGSAVGTLIATGVLAVVWLLGWTVSLVGRRRLPGHWRWSRGDV